MKDNWTEIFKSLSEEWDKQPSIPTEPPSYIENYNPEYWPHLDPPQTELIGDQALTSNVSMEFNINRVIIAYRNAVEFVYGQKKLIFSRSGSLEKTKPKIYQNLVNATSALIRNEVPPQDWAEWRLKYYKSIGKPPPPITMIFSEKIIDKHSGWFFSLQPCKLKTKITQNDREQLCRLEEARHHLLKMHDPLLFLPPWYVKIRREEISRGYKDPLVLYTSINRRRVPL